MATLSEVLRGVPQGFVVLAGAVGLGREVSRVLHLRPSDVAAASVGQGDLVVYAARNGHSGASRSPDHALTTLLVSGTAGVLTDVEPNLNEVQAADKCGSPLLASIGGIETEQLRSHLVHALAAHESLLEVQRTELQRTMADLACAGATPAMLVERLAATTGKVTLLRPTADGEEHLCQPVLQELEPDLVRRAIAASGPPTVRWPRSIDLAAGSSLYLELPTERLVRLVAPVWVEGSVRAELSLFARPDDLVARDRIALLAAADAIATASTQPSVEVAGVIGRRRCAAVALRGADANTDGLAGAARRHFEEARFAPSNGPNEVRLSVALESVDRPEWTSRLVEWQAQLAEEFGSVSIGHALRMGGQPSDVRYALAQATEAVLVGDRLFGAGHVTSYADAQLANFLLGRRDTYELRALFEQAVGKLAAEDAKRERDLVRTLEVYCETFSTQRTAERLQVHRNTVLYRLRQIEEITSFDLEDGPSRLLLQLGLLAGRLVRQTRPNRSVAPATRVRALEEILSA